MPFRPSAASLLCAFLLLASLLALRADDKPAKPAESKFYAALIWGTDGEKPEGKKLKDVDPSLVERFRKVFKWKNYFEVKREEFVLRPDGSEKELEMSEKCRVKVRWSEQEGMSVELIGEGKSIEKRKFPMPLAEPLVLGGDLKNETAWLVVLKPE